MCIICSQLVCVSTIKDIFFLLSTNDDGPFIIKMKPFFHHWNLRFLTNLVKMA